VDDGNPTVLLEIGFDLGCGHGSGDVNFMDFFVVPVFLSVRCLLEEYGMAVVCQFDGFLLSF